MHISTVAMFASTTLAASSLAQVASSQAPPVPPEMAGTFDSSSSPPSYGLAIDLKDEQLQQIVRQQATQSHSWEKKSSTNRLADGDRSPIRPFLSSLGAQVLLSKGPYNDLTTQQPQPENLQTREIVERVVKDIQIRFVNKSGQSIQGRTSRDFILGQLKLKTGQMFRQNTLESDLRRLRRMDLFRDVKVALEEDATGVKVIYDIRESSFRSLGVGGGNSGDLGLFGTLTYRDRNIGGNYQQFRAKIQVARDDFQYSLRFTNPYRLSEPDRLGYSVAIFRSRDFSQTFNKDIDLPNGDDVLEGRFGSSVQLLRSFNDWNAALGLNYTRISSRDRDWDLQQLDELGNPLSLSGSGIDELFTVSLGIMRDWRNRSSNATSGSLLSFSTEQSIPIGEGNIFMNRLRVNYVQYVPVRPLSEEELSKNSELAEVLAFNLQAGTVLGDLPPTEAFQLGGSNSVRGYAYSDLASARTFVLGSFEYRFPIASSLGGAIFFDLGSDFGTGDTIVGEPGVLRNKPGSGFGYGIGVRVPSPLGLLRGDLGINDRGDMRFEISTGQRF